MRLEEVLSKLEKRISQASYRYSGYDLEPEDVRQNIILAIMEQADKDPEFLDQSPNYIYQAAVWRVRNNRKAIQTRNRYISPAPISAMSINGDDDEPMDILEIYEDSTPNPEQETIETEKLNQIIQAIRSLDDTHRKIVSMIYAGYKGCEIAEDMGISPSRVSQHKSHIRAHFSNYIAS